YPLSRRAPSAARPPLQQILSTQNYYYIFRPPTMINL
ncbi:uncharacterized protein METZ01_LOCUS63041, partial [marine metagenome]